MSDVALAHDLVAEIAGHCWRGKGDMIDRVYDAIVTHLPKDQCQHWTRRRVRAFWHKEAASVRYHEMIELAQVAKTEREHRQELEEARRSHAEYVAETARLASMLERQDADFHCNQIEAMGGFCSGMGLPGGHYK